MLLNVLLFNFFPQVSLQWHQLLIHCQDSSAVFSHALYFCARPVRHMGSWDGGRCYCTAAAEWFHLSLQTQTLLQNHILLWHERAFLSSCHGVNSIPRSPTDDPTFTQHPASWFRVLGLQEAERSLLFPNHLLCCFELYSDCITLYLNTVLILLSSCVFHFYYSAS